MPNRSKTISARRSWRNCAACSTGRSGCSATTASGSAANWKLYAENTRDNYHASLLHEFLVTFGLDRSTQIGGVKMDARHRHNITWAEADSDTDELAHQAYAGAGVRNDFLSLKEPSLVAFRPERDDKLNLAITSVFPSAVFVQISNSLAVRQIRPRGVDEVEVFQTMLGYEDDPPEMTLHRLRQANLVGPAGLVSMEDGEAIEIAHRASGPDPDGDNGHRARRRRSDFRPRLPGQRRAVARLLVVLRRAVGHRAGRRGAMKAERAAICRSARRVRRADRRGAIRRMARPLRRGVPLSDRAAGELRPRSAGGTGLLRQPRDARRPHPGVARSQQIQHPHRPPSSSACRGSTDDRVPVGVEAPFAVFQTDQEGETRLFATGLYRDRLDTCGTAPQNPRQADLLDTFAVPHLLATPL